MFTPQNEQGVIVEFSQNCHKFSMEIVSIQTEFPDAIIRWKGKELRVEFEYRSSSFYTHGHDPRLCDLIVCWDDDYFGSLPIITLSYDDWGINEEFRLATPQEKENEYLLMQLESALNQVKRLEGELQAARFKNTVTFSDSQAAEFCQLAQNCEPHDVALLLFSYDVINAQQTADIIGVKDVRTVQSRAAKLNGVTK